MFNDFLSLIFSETCSSCGMSLYKNESFMCLKCRYHLPKTNFHKDFENVLTKRLWGRVPLQFGLAYLKFNKGGSVQNLLYKIKYKGDKEGARKLGLWYGEELKNKGFTNQFDAIVPVPLHKKRFAKRGFNQSEMFAMGFGESFGVEVLNDVLIRTNHKASQTGMGRFERWQNVKDVYKVNDNEILKGKHILLADDVITTGATIEACSKELLQAGVKTLSIVAIACAE